MFMKGIFYQSKYNLLVIQVQSFNLTAMNIISKRIPYDLILVRHAQSNFNKGYLEYLEKHQLQILWEDCIKIEHFNEVVSYAKEHFDCSITQKGIQQCKNTRKLLEKQSIGIVLVSPYQRALETCREIFGNRNIKIQVHPFLAEVFRYSCDIGQRLEDKQKQFTEFDFTHMKDSSELWFIQNLAPHHQQNWKQYQQKQESLTFEEKQEILLNFVKSKVIYESCQQLRERIWKVKQMLLEYKQKYGKVAVVTHYHIVNTILAQKFDEHGQIIKPIYVQNAQPYFDSIQRLLQFK